MNGNHITWPLILSVEERVLSVCDFERVLKRLQKIELTTRVQVCRC